MSAKVVSITSKADAERLADIHQRVLSSVIALRARLHDKDTKSLIRPDEIKLILDGGDADIRALEAGYLALTGSRLKREIKV